MNIIAILALIFSGLSLTGTAIIFKGLKICMRMLASVPDMIKAITSASSVKKICGVDNCFLTPHFNSQNEMIITNTAKLSEGIVYQDIFLKRAPKDRFEYDMDGVAIEVADGYLVEVGGKQVVWMPDI